MKKFEFFLARPEPLVNDMLSLKTSGSGDENAIHLDGTFIHACSERITPTYPTGRYGQMLCHPLCHSSQFHWGKAGINENYDGKKGNTIDDWKVNPSSKL